MILLEHVCVCCQVRGITVFGLSTVLFVSASTTEVVLEYLCVCCRVRLKMIVVLSATSFVIVPTTEMLLEHMCVFVVELEG